jgi:methyl-accepting chemotaxis protein
MKIGSFFRNLKISKKMLLAPIVVLLFLIILFFGTYWGLSNQKAAVEDIFNDRFQNYQISSRVMYEISRTHSNVYKVISWASSHYDKEKVDALGKEQMNSIEQNIGRLQQVLQSNITEEEKKLYQASLDRLLEYRKPARDVLEVATVDLTTGTMVMSITDEKFQSLTKSLEELLALENKLSKDKFDFSISTFKDTLRIFVAVFLVAVVLSVLISVFLSRLVSSSLHRTVAVIRKVAEGDLTQDIASNSNDELGYLAQSVNEMRMKMNEVVGQSVTMSQTLSEAASEQASSLEETSSSLEEMASMTKQNAGNASEANRLMGASREVIEKADGSMGKLTGSMQEIAQASEETGKIIKTIDEIAFQTNLLALNAAVEAARAGQAGAGFAVVADEVRNLAMRAAEAAKNTTGLMEDIVRKVRNGEKLVGVTNEAFREITGSSLKVVNLIGEIAAASQEQFQGIEQVNKAVAQMNIVTQQNAAGAEELASVMAMFRTGDNGEFRNIHENKARPALASHLPVPADRV